MFLLSLPDLHDSSTPKNHHQHSHYRSHQQNYRWQRQHTHQFSNIHVSLKDVLKNAQVTSRSSRNVQEKGACCCHHSNVPCNSSSSNNNNHPNHAATSKMRTTALSKDWSIVRTRAYKKFWSLFHQRQNQINLWHPSTAHPTSNRQPMPLDWTITTLDFFVMTHDCNNKRGKSNSPSSSSTTTMNGIRRDGKMHYGGYTTHCRSIFVQEGRRNPLWFCYFQF
jgi:hypothetical protein